MSDLPEAFRSISRVARKDHKCCECNTTIEKGTHYRYSSGIWHSRPSSFKQCLECWNIMSAAVDSVVDPSAQGPAFGELRRWFEDRMTYDFKGQEFIEGMAKVVGISPQELNRLLKIED